MSFNRENIIWQSDDGSWNRGFFKATVTGDDPEWDVVYDYAVFEWARTGMESVDEADSCWPGLNPGGFEVLRKHPATHRRRSFYDTIAKEWGN
jgi:hypothetical protein